MTDASSTPFSTSETGPEAGTPAADRDRDVEGRAAEVSDYLVAIRGGAPFLSARDNHLLLGWLEAGLPVPCILAGIDDVALRRRRKRVQSRLTLTACKKAIESARGRTPTSADPDTDISQPRTTAPGLAGLAALATELAHQSVSPPLLPELQALVLTLSDLASRSEHVDQIGRQAAAAVTRFHTAAWKAATSEHEALRKQAEAQLAPMRDILRGPAWSDMVEEVARDLLRQRTPAVSARRVWDTIAP